MFLNRHVDRMKLMVTGHLLSDRSATEIFKCDEVTNQIEKSSLVEHTLGL